MKIESTDIKRALDLGWRIDTASLIPHLLPPVGDPFIHYAAEWITHSYDGHLLRVPGYLLKWLEGKGSLADELRKLTAANQGDMVLNDLYEQLIKKAKRAAKAGLNHCSIPVGSAVTNDKIEALIIKLKADGLTAGFRRIDRLLHISW